MIVEVNLKEIAAKLALAGDDEQSDFLNTFGQELTIVCKTHARYESQICDLTKSLDIHGRELIEEIYEFMKIMEREDHYCNK